MEARRLKAHSPRAALLLAFGLLGAYLFTRAWVAEDAYISFRVVDNALMGYGLRWNIYERVQAYTHPLWLLLHLPLQALWGNIFHVTMALSFACSLAAIAVMLAALRAPPLLMLGALLVPFAASKTLVDYSSSGLENPLSMLLFSCFCFLLLRLSQHRHFWFFLSLSVTLALFNRLDMALLYAPAMALLLWPMRQHLPLKPLLLGALPLLAWFAFALFYYGFALPNTRYAKLGTDLPLSQYLEQGFRYFNYLLTLDLAGALLLLSSFLFLLAPRLLHVPSLPHARLPQAIALGIYLYSLYVLAIGGDYMAGRFWSLPVFAALCLWAIWATKRRRPDFAFLLSVVALGAMLATPLIGKLNDACGKCIPLGGRVTNAYVTFRMNRLFTEDWRIRYAPEYRFVKRGREIAAMQPPPLRALRYIGLIGYYAGPQAKLIDTLGLADPLLARLPASRQQNFYIGHFRRDIPGGYPHALQTGSLNQMSAPLADYYEKLRLITAGDLWNSERLKTILLFNLGAYEPLKQQYLDARTR